MSREGVASEFANSIGAQMEGRGGMGFGETWSFVIGKSGFGPPRAFFDLPTPAAPLHEHLAFVGRVAEALAPEWRLAICGYWGEKEFHVDFHRRNGDSAASSTDGVASDPSWAAMISAIAAKAR